MIPDSNPEFREESTKSRPAPARRDSSTGFVIAVLVLGLMMGFVAGWLTFRSPWAVASSTPLYDEALVTSLFDSAGRAVVEVNVARSPTGETSGSGFLVDSAGHVVTNHHVLDGGGDVTVRLFDGRVLSAERLGTSPADDLALVRVDPDDLVGLEPLSLADSDAVRPGQLAVAIGSPFRNLNSISVGVVSGIGRSRVSELSRPIPDLIQTDAALNPGNSGGPLLNSEGDVIGVTNAVQVVSSVQIGVGFAIPSNTLSGILDDLKTPGELKRALAWH